MRRIKVIDSHTGGEPTRIVYENGPERGGESLAERLERFRNDFDHIRSAVVNEPRGSEVLVSGLVCKPVDTTCAAGIIFFNNAGYLGMCGHGLIGLMVTLQHLGRIAPGDHRIETPVGTVTAKLAANGSVAVENVSSFRYLHEVSVDVPDYGAVTGDVAWGGNWFFLVKDSAEILEVENATHLTRITVAIKKALANNNITGSDGAMVDHIELFSEPKDPNNDSRNFVLCPGNAYDRSPCGTGTSAKLACLAADGKLPVGAIWKQESIVGSVFECSYRPDEGADLQAIIPTINGTAFVSAEAELILNPNDPFCMGIGS